MFSETRLAKGTASNFPNNFFQELRLAAVGVEEQYDSAIDNGVLQLGSVSNEPDGRTDSMADATGVPAMVAEEVKRVLARPPAYMPDATGWCY